MYAVIDVETTGLRTSWHDRVVEMAVVQLDGHGRVEHRWCSLVNPDRDLGHAGLGPHRAHSALHDALAAGELLRCYLAAAGEPPPWTDVTARATSQPWPAVPTTEAAPVPRRRPGHHEPHFLARLVDRLPRLREPRGDAYLDLLDRALLDRHISDTEADALVDAAHGLGLARADVVHLHRRYLDSLAAAALDDGVVTTDERYDLRAVATLLGLDKAAVDDALAAAETLAPPGRRDDGAGPRRPTWRLSGGDIVVFTGAMRPPREDWETEAVAAGLRVGDGVTRKTRLLVAADPDSMSGKAKKARQYGVPIVHPTAYRRMLAVTAEQ